MDIEAQIARLVAIALEEDIGEGDVTTDAIVDRSRVNEAFVIAGQDLILSGLDVAQKVFERLNRKIHFIHIKEEGDRVREGELIARMKGAAADILAGERTALNFLQHLSGIATLTSKYVERIKNTKTKILDTRKTTPGMRLLEKRAVRAGGGENHRIGLFDMILIKENHVTAAGSISKAVELARAKHGDRYKIEVEAEDMIGVLEALKANADIIMLDNMSIGDMEDAINRIKGKAKVEISGNVSLDNLERIAALEPDFISVGKITHSAPAVDISLEFISDITKG